MSFFEFWKSQLTNFMSPQGIESGISQVPDACLNHCAMMGVGLIHSYNPPLEKLVLMILIFNEK